jgi:hypothetical protein
LRRCSSILGTEMGAAAMLVDFLASAATTEFHITDSFNRWSWRIMVSRLVTMKRMRMW